MKVDWDKIKLPPEYPKPRAVVPDCLVEQAREMWGDRVEVIPVSPMSESQRFEEWFERQRREDWYSKYPNEAFHENWGLGFKYYMRQGWMARAAETQEGG